MSVPKSNKTIPVLFIVGPTSTGKTALADQLATMFNGELISADSRQVYKGLDIVTGKDHPHSPIHGLDLVSPDGEWNASLFADFALKKIDEIASRTSLPIIVGGTGLYIDAILNPLTKIVPPNKALRTRLEALGLKEQQQELIKINKEYFNNLNHSDQNNPRRLVRAIEVLISKQKKVSLSKESPLLDPLIIGLSAPLDFLETRIRSRVENRLKKDPKKELQYLKSFGLIGRKPAITSLGYEELDQFYQGGITKEGLLDLWTTHERQYAKKQLTWFKKRESINWFDTRERDLRTKVVDLVSNWYTKPTKNN